MNANPIIYTVFDLTNSAVCWGVEGACWGGAYIAVLECLELEKRSCLIKPEERELLAQVLHSPGQSDRGLLSA
jgi:hypothetical protein